MAEICSTGFGLFFNNTIIPLMAYAALATSILIAISFMVGRAISNPKLTLWSKTETMQLVISLASVFFLTTIINTFCYHVDMAEVHQIFLPEEPAPPSTPLYDAAEGYLVEAAEYSHDAMTVVRYHLEAYTVLSFLNAFECDFTTGSIGWGCLFGYSGKNLQPLGGYGATMAALNIFFNSTIIAHFTALNFLFILLFTYKGFVFIMLPLGVFLRALPYMRSFGSLLISLALSFLVVYPLMLGVFWLMKDAILDVPALDPPLTYYHDESVFPEASGGGQSAAAAFAGAGYIEGEYFPAGPNVPGAIMFAAWAFIAAVFLPTVALLATIASVSYLARLYGEEIDLSRLTQLV